MVREVQVPRRPGGRGCRRAALLPVAVLLVSAAVSTASEGSTVPTEELLSGAVLGFSDDPPASLVGNDDVIALSDEMREFLADNVSADAHEKFKLNQLIFAVITRSSFGIEYDEKTRTPAEAFSARRGNCLSFTYMFVALARGVGLDARFQEVDIPPDWTFTDTYVLNRHINIDIDLGTDGHHVVDFNIADFQGEYDTKVISDERARAHFFNNLGAEFLQEGQTAEAFHAFRRALAENDPEFGPAWSNLGTLYSREGVADFAEAAYRRALELDPSDLTAMSNLTALYDRRGDADQAEHYRKKVESHRRKNPYFRYHLARLAYAAGEYEMAVGHLKFAIHEQRKEDRFRFLLGLVYLQLGEEKKAVRCLERARRLAGSEASERAYSAKIEKLLAASK